MNEKQFGILGVLSILGKVICKKCGIEMQETVVLHDVPAHRCPKCGRYNFTGGQIEDTGQKTEERLDDTDEDYLPDDEYLLAQYLDEEEDLIVQAAKIYKKKLLPPCPPEEQEYYKTLFGFDPIEDRSVLPFSYGIENGNYNVPYRYEAEFPLAQDPPLSVMGVTMLARVEIDCQIHIHNSIVFRWGAKESYVDCVHTVAYEGRAEKIEENKETYVKPPQRTQSRDNPIVLPPWGHFAALKSFVGAVAEFGVTQIITYPISPRRSKAGSAPYGMGPELREQFLNSLEEIVPSATAAIRRDYLIDLLEKSTLNWLVSHRSKAFPVNDSLMPKSWEDPKKIWEDLYKYAPVDWIEAHQEKIETFIGRFVVHENKSP